VRKERERERKKEEEKIERERGRRGEAFISNNVLQELLLF
jgi:hypothetical protein